MPRKQDHKDDTMSLNDKEKLRSVEMILDLDSEHEEARTFVLISHIHTDGECSGKVGLSSNSDKLMAAALAIEAAGRILHSFIDEMDEEEEI